MNADGITYVPLKHVIQSMVGGGTPSRAVTSYWDGNIPWASVKDFTDDMTELSSTLEHVSLVAIQASAANLISSDNLVVCTRMAVGRCAMTTREIAINQDLKALIPNAKTVDARYLLHCMKRLQPRLASISVGSTVKGISAKDLLGQTITLVPLPEQRRIAEILDTVDEAIRRTEQVIEKLQQMKQGLLRDLLTHGIDDNGELRPPPDEAPHLYKDSPLGLIPRAWKILRVQDVSTRITDGDHHTPVRAAQGVFLLSARNVLDGQLDLSDVDFIPKFEYERMIRRCFPEAGDLLVSCSGTIGRVCEVPEGFDCALVRSAALVKLNRQLANARYMEWVLLSDITKQQIRARQKQGAQPNLFQGEIAELLIALPPMTEQSDISRLLDGAMLRLRREEGVTTKLRTLKKGLMDDLLTGRVRVNVPEGEC